MSKELTINEGTISFWLKERSIEFNSDSIDKLFAIDPMGGSILIIKDSDKKIKAFFVIIGKGMFDLGANVIDLNKELPHLVTFTWSTKELCLYIDGELKDGKEFSI